LARNAISISPGVERLGSIARNMGTDPVPCKHFPSQTWIHLVWNFERVGNQVHYIDLSVAGNSYNVDVYYTAQPNWYQEEIDIAFQLDGNYEQEPYNVWLDEATLNAY